MLLLQLSKHFLCFMLHWSNEGHLFQVYGEGFVTACLNLYADVNGEAKVLIDSIVLTIIRTVPRSHWPNITPLLRLIISDLNEFSDYSKVTFVLGI